MSEQLVSACETGDVDVVNVLLGCVGVNAACWTNLAIRVASENGHVEVVKVLLADPRVDPSARDNYAVVVASQHGNVKAVKLLLADPRVRPGADVALDILRLRVRSAVSML